ncbi:L-threonylcarbamoyladenylate synthase [Runella slithyformis]|uniref:Threonylcarbamoyl-AMP synthase n=1 Tax=Runella slithyformis (strain ATCC 29530 / DSM 19594 / LMG 11500 / NCIMB 11436 / LSU 4) TaxID=761193 RepID=A0A7U3ZMT0_RUNSL|nr:L-threonylcarbamoyladenylate synthase [Runella slithyformis]AEI50101.1 Sua5/YciO/YrdC/YwlC family protein [Runella slithyformis DSM 19594]
MAIIGTDILTVKKLLEAGEVAGIPTETVYGLAGNAFDDDAVLKIFSVKNRPQFDPLIVHTHSISAVSAFVRSFPKKARQLADAFWPGPLTLLLPKSDAVSDLVTSGLDTVAVRIPSHPLTLALLSSLDFPLAAPSANPFGYISPTSALHVDQQLGSKIPYILNGGESQVGIESTIVGFEGEETIVYRLGGTSIEAIEGIIGPVAQVVHSTSNPKAPGMLKSHYAPRKPLFINQLSETLKCYPSDKIGSLTFENVLPELPVDHQRILSPAANYAEAAKRLFAYMRQLDTLPIDVIHAELLPEKDLGRAINDRIRRAAVRGE